MIALTVMAGPRAKPPIEVAGDLALRDFSEWSLDGGL
jgi:hypothetical protein